MGTILRYTILSILVAVLINTKFQCSGRQLEVCTWAWELLTEVFKLPKDRLYVTYFGGDASAGLAPDEEAIKIWRDLGQVNFYILIVLFQGDEQY